MDPSLRDHGMRHALSLLFATLAIVAVTMMPGVAAAQEEHGEVVRVGWYESPFNTIDDMGRRSGYAYDYQQEIAAYTGWTYEYVEGSWSELLQMLEDGKIDLMSDVSYTDERAQKILYSNLPMGAEEYYLFASPGNKEISPDDYATFNGKKIGANKGSVQINYYRAWAEANGVEAELVELAGTEEENLKDLARGNIDMYLSLDGFFEGTSVVPVCKVGSSNYFFAVSKTRPELLTELNSAMSRIEDDNQYFNQTLYAKYLQTSATNNYLTVTETDWLAGHGPIRVGYQDDYLAFCAKDPETGELTGALKDYLDVVSNSMENASLEFEPVCYPTAAAAMDGLKAGEVDCVFPANLTAYDGEVRGVFVTPPLMSTDMSAIIREKDQSSFGSNERITVAVNADNPNYDLFLQDHFPDWRAIYFDDTQACIKAVADEQADCLLISNYRYNNIAEQCEKSGLTTWSTGVENDFCFALNRGDTTLYSILAKTTSVVPESTVDAALMHYYTEDAKDVAANPLSQHIVGILVTVIVVTALGLVLLVRGMQSNKKSDKHYRLAPTSKDFTLLDDLPLSYSVYRLTHAEHSELYDATIVYVNHKFEELGGLLASDVVGRSVRELYPYIGEQWYQNARSAAMEGETVEIEYVDPLHGKEFLATFQQVYDVGYCAVIYQKK